MTTLDQYIRNQYENNRFIQITDFDRLLANKANTGTCINMAALTEIARQLGADEIARGCQLEELHRMALNCAFEDLGIEVTPYRSVTLNAPLETKLCCKCTSVRILTKISISRSMCRSCVRD